MTDQLLWLFVVFLFAVQKLVIFNLKCCFNECFKLPILQISHVMPINLNAKTVDAYWDDGFVTMKPIAVMARTKILKRAVSGVFFFIRSPHFPGITNGINKFLKYNLSIFMWHTVAAPKYIIYTENYLLLFLAYSFLSLASSSSLLDIAIFRWKYSIFFLRVKRFICVDGLEWDVIELLLAARIARARATAIYFESKIQKPRPTLS